MVGRAVKTAIVLGLVTLRSMGASENAGAAYMGVQPELIYHLSQAKLELDRGDAERALARTDLVLVGRKPLSIEVRRYGPATMRTEECDTALNGALKMWESAFGEKPFRIAEPGETGDIQVSFVAEVERNNKPLGGFVTWKRYVSSTCVPITSADIQVRVCQPQGGWMSPEAMRHEIAHELGHVLGLTDREGEGHVMCALNLQNPVSTIEQDDVATLLRVRQEALDLRQRTTANADATTHH